MKTDEIRSRFLEFFKKKAHVVVLSDSLVPHDDPTLLFTGAGMNQFKDYFLGLKKDLRRAASSQKCLRTGDLDEVGRTAYHHSFFEMLGNFSFGDYFKEEAIKWAWEFLTVEVKIPKDRLRISVHTSDDEAYKIWKDQIGIREDWISRLGDKSNFWPSNAPKDGPNGPCGPCSEIYFDQGENYLGAPHPCSLEHGCGRFTEIWNLVFTQFNRQDGGRLVPLKKKNIDTGMGLERLACVIQGKRSNCEIDIFQPLIEEVQKILGVKRQDSVFPRLCAITDHIRATAFSIADGVLPGNEGRGYVIRKLIRRAVWHAYQLMPEGSFEEPMLYRLVPHIVRVMKTAYPELSNAQKNIEDTIKGEEDRFLRTLSTGLALLREKIALAKQKKQKTLSGADAFLLYDTYGFPAELTRIIAGAESLEIDQKEFDDLMQKQRDRAKGTSALVGSIFVTSDFDKKLHALPATNFLGYTAHTSKAKVLLVQLENGKGVVVLDQTPFYGESGGQAGDEGMIKNKNFEARVEDAQKKDHYVLHYIQTVRGEIKEGVEVEVQIDSSRRDRAMRNHTATHLLHAVLREVLGPQVRQLGSLVHPDRLRFDYSFSRALNEEELKLTETRVNQEILQDKSVSKEEKGIEEAKKEGALAFFGEKYGERVRIVTIPGISKEFCGGTHCDRTGQIGVFVITSDSSIASGVRRMEALTGEGALHYIQRLRSQIGQAAEKLKVSPLDLVERIEKLQGKMKQLEKSSESRTSFQIDPKDLVKAAKRAGPFQLIAEKLSGAEREDLRKISDSLRSQTKQTLWILAAPVEDKINLLIGISADLKNSWVDARELIRKISSILEGSGGGRQDLAEGGGTRLDILEKDWGSIQETVSEYLIHSPRKD